MTDGAALAARLAVEARLASRDTLVRSGMTEISRLRRVVRLGESTTAEFKSAHQVNTKDERADLAKDAIAILNACARLGHIVLGAHDDGTPSRIDHTSLTEERVQKILNEYCEPNVDATLRHIDVGGNPVSVIELCRRTVDLPYRAAKTAGQGPVLEKAQVYYRYGRHSEKARYPEIASLVGQAERARARQHRVAPPADEYRYFSPEQKRDAMMRDWRAALRKCGLRLSRRVYHYAMPGKRPSIWERPFREVIAAETTINGSEYLLLSLVRPERVRANVLEGQFWSRHRWMAQSRTGLRRLLVVVAHDAVGRPLRPGLSRQVVVEREQFGWYAGSSPGFSMDAHLFLEYVRSKATMEQAVAEVLDWIATQADRANLLLDD